MTLTVFETLTVGPLEENCYLAGNAATRDAVCVDPGWDAERIVDAVRRQNVRVHAVLVTHAHADHIMAGPDVADVFGVPVIAPDGEQELWSMAGDFCAFWGFPAPQPRAADQWISAGTTLAFGTLALDTLDVRGHSPAALAFRADAHVFAGDALFAGSIGRTDLPGGDAATLIDRIRRNLLSLPPETVVLPGHGPATTIGQETRWNPFLADGGGA